MAPLFIEYGFDLRHTRSYMSQENAVKAVEMRLAAIREAGVVFNVTIVEQLWEGSHRFVPLLSAFRAPNSFAGGDTQAAIIAARAGFVVFR